MIEREPGCTTGSLRPEPDVQLYFSNMNLPEAVIATAGVERLRRVLDDINEGDVPQLDYEITLTRPLVFDALGGRFRSRQGQRQPFRRVHQTWPEGIIKGTLRAPTVRSAAINAAALLIMPETHRSGRTIERISRQVGGAAAIVYADLRDGNGELVDYSDFDIVTSAVQPSPEQLIGTGALDPDDPYGSYNYRRFHDSLWVRGIHGLVTDNHHLERAADGYPYLYLDWKRLLNDAKKTGTNIMGGHASAGRADSAHKVDRDRSQRELTAIFAGPDAISETDMGEILALSYKIWRDQRALGRLPDGRFKESDKVHTDHLQRRKDGGGHLWSEDYFRNIAQDPVEAQFRQENTYRQWLHGRSDKYPLTIEIPHRGMVAYRGLKRLRMSDLVSMHRDVAQSWFEYFLRLRLAYDSANLTKESNAGGQSREW